MDTNTALHPSILELKVEVDKLHSLLADPEPGLITWSLMVGEAIAAIVALQKKYGPK